MIKKINFLFVTLFGIGKIKYAPGTFGSLFAAILLFDLFHLLNISPNLIFLFLVIIFLYSFFAINSFIKNNRNKDPNEIVIDEFIGQSLPIYLYEISHGTEKELNDAIIFYIVIFILFRFFDIIKPFPINFIDKKFKNSVGVVFDDVIAGVYVILILILFMIFKTHFL